MIRAPALMTGLVLTVLVSTTLAREEDAEHPAVAIVLRPAAEPVPALKYRILPERSTQIPGNAAIFYHRAILMFQDTRQRTRRAKESPATEEQASGQWITGPLNAIPHDQARQWLETYRSSLHETELGARRLTCNWEFDSRTEGIELMLPEMQEMRALGRLVALRARFAVLDGKIDEAVYWIQTGYAMARHVSEGPILIQSLVGVSLSELMAKVLEDLIQAPGTPSLYWALANRPRPFIDMTAAYEGERFDLEREVPQLRELDGVPWSVEKARMFTAELQEKLFKFAGLAARAPSASGSGGVQDWSYKLGLAALVAQAYPEAKRALIAQRRPAAQVEAMPAVQVAALHTFQSYQQLRDDVFKWTGLPYYQAYKAMDGSSTTRQSHANMNMLLKLFTMLLPAIRSVQVAQLRADRHLDAIECIEAIRLYAAAHGQFPRKLEEISEAPAPIDPATGHPFDYRVEGDRAILSAPSPPGAPDIPQFKINYELKWTR
ncbi:MAG: hypothetical protein ACHRXM_32045 [Isosphaerales bacterium]